jgi:hypothetical protein
MQPTNIGSSRPILPQTPASSANGRPDQSAATASSAPTDVYNAQMANYNAEMANCRATIDSLIQQKHDLLTTLPAGERRDVVMHELNSAHEKVMQEFTVAHNSLTIVSSLAEKERDADILFVGNL